MARIGKGWSLLAVLGLLPGLAWGESSTTSASITTLVQNPNSDLLKAQAELKSAQAREEQKKAAASVAEIEQGSAVEIGLKPEVRQVRHGDLLRKAAGGDAAAEAEWKRLEGKERVEALLLALDYGTVELRKRALLEIRTLSNLDDPEGRLVPFLVQAAVQDPDPQIREGAREKLLADKDQRVPGLLVKDFKKREPEERRRRLEILNGFGAPKVYRAVIEHWREMWGPGPRAHFFVARQQSYVADYEISGDSYDPTVRQFLVGVVLDVKSVAAWADIYEVTLLEEVTGQQLGRDLGKWRAWWKDGRPMGAEEGQAQPAQEDRQKKEESRPKAEQR